MKEIIAIAGADIHLNKWKELNPGQSRLEVGLKSLRIMAKHAQKERVPVLIPGDLIDNATWMHNEVFNAVMDFFEKFRNVTFYISSGNHDMSERNSLANKSPSWITGLSKRLSNIICVDGDTFVMHNKYKGTRYTSVSGIPYLNGNVDFKIYLKELRLQLKKIQNPPAPIKDLFKILLIHSDLPNAKEPDGREVGSVENISKNFKKIFKGFDLVLSGHVHKPQILKDKDGFPIYMLGSTNQQRMSDENCDMGYWIIYRNHKPKFISLNNKLPTYKFYEDDTEKTNDTDYWIKLGETLEEDEEITTQFSVTNKRSSLAKKYCKVKGITSKSKRKILIKLLNSI